MVMEARVKILARMGTQVRSLFSPTTCSPQAGEEVGASHYTVGAYGAGTPSSLRLKGKAWDRKLTMTSQQSPEGD